MSDIPQVAIDRAVEEVMSFYEDDAPWRMDAERFVKVAAPVIAEAAVEGVKAEIQRLIDKYQDIHDDREPEAVAVMCGTALGHADELRAVLAAIDKEGEGK